MLLEDALPELLKTLCEGNVRRNIEQHQALTKLLADILDFSFEFDYLKVIKCFVEELNYIPFKYKKLHFMYLYYLSWSHLIDENSFYSK